MPTSRFGRHRLIFTWQKSGTRRHNALQPGLERSVAVERPKLRRTVTILQHKGSLNTIHSTVTRSLLAFVSHFGGSQKIRVATELFAVSLGSFSHLHTDSVTIVTTRTGRGLYFAANCCRKSRCTRRSRLRHGALYRRLRCSEPLNFPSSFNYRRRVRSEPVRNISYISTSAAC